MATPQSIAQKVNINTAIREELMQLPGIDEIKADHIIEYRQAHGPFRGPEEIANVSRSGTDRYEQFRNFITTGEKAF